MTNAQNNNEATTAENKNTEDTTASEPVQLTINDLQILGRIVDLASRRGAFQAGELTQVGEAYDKLAGFLSYVESMQAKEKAEAEAGNSASATSAAE